MLSLEVFKAAINLNGVMPRNRFIFGFVPPLAMADFSGESITDFIVDVEEISTLPLLTMYCKKAVIPGSAYNVTSININGSYSKIANDRDYDPITLEFYLDKRFTVYQYFKTWHDLAHNPFNQLREYPERYQSQQCWLTVLDNEGKPDVRRQFKFERMFPSEIGPIEVDAEAENEAMILPVTFDYTYFYNERDEILWQLQHLGNLGLF